LGSGFPNQGQPGYPADPRKASATGFVARAAPSRRKRSPKPRGSTNAFGELGGYIGPSPTTDHPRGLIGETPSAGISPSTVATGSAQLHSVCLPAHRTDTVEEEILESEKETGTCRRYHYHRL